MRLRWVFTVQAAVIPPKNTFEFMFLMGLDHLYTGRTGGSARGKGYNKFSSVPCGLEPAWQALKGDGEGGIWAQEGERKGTPARRPLFSPFFTLRL